MARRCVDGHDGDKACRFLRAETHLQDLTGLRQTRQCSTHCSLKKSKSREGMRRNTLPWAGEFSFQKISWTRRGRFIYTTYLNNSESVGSNDPTKKCAAQYTRLLDYHYETVKKAARLRTAARHPLLHIVYTYLYHMLALTYMPVENRVDVDTRENNGNLVGYPNALRRSVQSTDSRVHGYTVIPPRFSRGRSCGSRGELLRTMGGRGKKSAKGARSKPKRVAKVACIDHSGKQSIPDPWIGLRCVRTMYCT